MNSLGIKADTLFEIGITEHLSCHGEMINSTTNDDIPIHIKLMLSENQAVLKAVAKMIEENNKAIFEQLTSKGSL